MHWREDMWILSTKNYLILLRKNFKDVKNGRIYYICVSGKSSVVKMWSVVQCNSNHNSKGFLEIEIDKLILKLYGYANDLE